MAYAFPGGVPVDYAPCRYGDSRLQFRGPYRQPRDRYLVALGGSETFGRNAVDPWPVLLERSLGQMVINLGLPNAGLDVYLRDPAVQSVARRAAAGFLQLPGAVNLSNRFYGVHPRRNDRVLRILPDLQRLYPEIDFIEFNFTNHLVLRLHDADEDRFALLHDELRRVWMARMTELLACLPPRTVLIWLAGMPMPDTGSLTVAPGPALVDRGMVAAVAGARPVVEIIVDPSADGIAGPGQVQGQERMHQGIASALLPLASTDEEKKTGARRRP